MHEFLKGFGLLGMLLLAGAGCAGGTSADEGPAASSGEAALCAEPGAAHACSTGGQQVIGRVVSRTGCGTLLEVERVSAGAGAGEKMNFTGHDPEVRQDILSLQKGDVVRIRYETSDDTHRKRPLKIEKVASAPAPAGKGDDRPAKAAAGRGTTKGTVISAAGALLKLKAGSGEEITFDVLKAAKEQAEALREGDQVEVSWARCPGGCCPTPKVLSVKRLASEQ